MEQVIKHQMQEDTWFRNWITVKRLQNSSEYNRADKLELLNFCLHKLNLKMKREKQCQNQNSYIHRLRHNCYKSSYITEISYSNKSVFEERNRLPCFVAKVFLPFFPQKVSTFLITSFISMQNSKTSHSKTFSLVISTVFTSSIKKH